MEVMKGIWGWRRRAGEEWVEKWKPWMDESAVVVRVYGSTQREGVN